MADEHLPPTQTFLQPVLATTETWEKGGSPPSVEGTLTHHPGEPASAAQGSVPTIPGYAILAEIGRGGMGVVYQARQTAANRLVALKMILSGELASESERQRFRTEAEAIARLNHPHIVTVYEVGEHQGRPFFSLEYLPGGNLGTKLDGTPLPGKQAAQLIEQLARGVAAAHRQGIIHRDLNPANVLLTADGTPKITDFGLAKEFGREAAPGAELTHTGAIMGTPSYMAPEQARATKTVGPAADIYALGAILYECLTGRPPFKAASVLETLELVRTREPVAPRQLQPSVPRDLETICLKCLEKTPDKRNATAQDLADDLRRYLNGEPVIARPASRFEKVVKWAKRKPSHAVAGGVSILASLLLFIGGIVFTNQVREARDQERHRAEELTIALVRVSHIFEVQEGEDVGVRTGRE